MNTHTIDRLEDFYALKSYVEEEGYKLLHPSSPSLSKLQNKDFLDYLEFAFVEDEKFIITLANAQKQQEACDWLKNFLPEMDTDEDLIFGKDKTQRIVSCETMDTGMEIFIENEDGTVTSKVVPNNFWCLASKRHDQNYKKLKGDLYYRYIKTFSNKDEWFDERRALRKEVYSVWEDKESAMIIGGFTYFKGMKVDDVSVLSFDIESNGVEKDSYSTVFLISNTFRKNGVITKKLFALDEYPNQGAMIDDWCKWVREMNPSVLLGHNIFSFDLQYLAHVAYLEGTSLRIGRDGSDVRFNEWESKFRKDGSQFYMYVKAYIYGREIIDTMFLSYKYDIGRKYDSYGLKKIIAQECEEAQEKLDAGEKIAPFLKQLVERQKNRQFYDAGRIKDMWNIPEEREKIKKYCEGDSDDALTLYDLMIPAMFYWTQSVPKSFQEIICTATGAQLNVLMIRSYLQHGHSIPAASDTEQYEGAISFGKPGIYRNLWKLDIQSLYPSIIRQYGVYDRFKDPAAHFLRLIEYFTIKRLEHKKIAKETGDLYYKDLEQSEKTAINSGYGFLGAPGLHFNSPQNAAFITKKGREILCYAIEWATGKKHD